MVMIHVPVNFSLSREGSKGGPMPPHPLKTFQTVQCSSHSSFCYNKNYTYEIKIHFSSYVHVRIFNMNSSFYSVDF